MLAFEGNASQGRSTSENRFSKRPLGGNDPPVESWSFTRNLASRYHSITSLAADFARQTYCKYYGSRRKREINNQLIPSNDLSKSAKMIRLKICLPRSNRWLVKEGSLSKLRVIKEISFKKGSVMGF